jgi:hypothetical protein
MVKLPTITVATLVHNREFILPQYLHYLYQLKYPKNLINILWILNNSNDQSETILQNFKKQYKNEYNNIRIEIYNTNCPNDDRSTEVREEYVYRNLANLRNVLCSKIKTDYMLSLDSDILLIDSETLNKLLFHQKDIVSSLIYNGYLFDLKRPSKYTNAMVKMPNGFFTHLSKLHIEKMKRNNESLLQLVDLTGAVCLIGREVLNNKNIKYDAHTHGEDGFWSECVKKEGFKLYIDLDCYNQHIMNQECLDLFLNGKLEN